MGVAQRPPHRPVRTHGRRGAFAGAGRCRRSRTRRGGRRVAQGAGRPARSSARPGDRSPRVDPHRRHRLEPPPRSRAQRGQGQQIGGHPGAATPVARPRRAGGPVLRPTRGRVVVAASAPTRLGGQAGHLVSGATAPSGLRIYRVSRVEAIEPTDEPASQPEGFNLRATWEALQRTSRRDCPRPR